LLPGTISSALLEGNKPAQAIQGAGRPPIPTAKKLRRCRDNQAARYGCVHHSGNARCDAGNYQHHSENAEPTSPRQETSAVFLIQVKEHQRSTGLMPIFAKVID
jgi:hypothetical protein